MLTTLTNTNLSQQPNKAQHTPGPWQIESFNDDTGYAEIQTVKRGTDCPEQGYQICYVSAASENDPTARLIAAAPELLAALESIQLTISHLMRTHGYSVESDWLGMFAFDVKDTAEAAIAKAKGQ